MSGQNVNEKQVQIYMSERNSGHIQVTAAAKAGISERSGRRIDKGQISPGVKSKRHWRTRKDPFTDVWDDEIIPILANAPELQPLTIFEHLCKVHPGKFQDSQLRTFQRRIKEWKALSGGDREVIFLQRQIPGRMGLSDFTTIKNDTITIKGEPLKHILYHFRLIYSGWCHVKVILGGESFSALSEGLQDALWRLGGVPCEHRTDSLSAAFKNMTNDDKEDATKRYEELYQHYDVIPTRNNRGVSHENGGIESPHGHLKNRIHQSILLRGSADFDSLEAYQQWIDTIVRGINIRNRDKTDEERKHLKQLPLQRTVAYTEKVVHVSTTSTMIVKRVLYTVPSRLKGERLRVHIYHDRLEIYLGTTHTLTLLRTFTTSPNQRARCVDYRHVIGSLERKPQAFRYSQLRDDLLPSEAYRQIWHWLDQELDPRKACKVIVGILSLANRADCEEALGSFMIRQKAKNILPSLHELEQKFDPKKIVVPDIEVALTSGGDYDALLPSFSREVD